MVDTPKKIACNPKSATRRDPWKQLLVVRTRTSSIFQPSCPTTTLLISFPSNSLQWSALYPFSWLFCIALDTALQVRRSRRDCRSSRYATTIRIYPPSWRAPGPHSDWSRDRVVGRLYTALRRAPPSVPRELHLGCVLTLGFCFSAIISCLLHCAVLKVVHVLNRIPVYPVAEKYLILMKDKLLVGYGLTFSIYKSEFYLDISVKNNGRMIERSTLDKTRF